MNASFEHGALVGLEKEISDALIDNCRLPAETVTSIEEAKRAMKLTFAEAAVHLGFVTVNEAQQAMAWVHDTHTKGNAGLIEAAVRRMKGNQSVVLRPAELVKPSANLILAHDMDNARSEQLRALRTQLLLLSTHEKQGTIIALLSPGSREGRSQLSAELAISFSQLGRRTLLVDGDLRSPQQHVLFNADNKWGLAQAMAFDELPRVYGVEGSPNLSLLTSGASVPNPLELLSGGGFEKLMAKWRQAYEFVIVDTPPISEYADGLAIATIARRVLVLSRGQATHQQEMKEMLKRLATTQSQVLGAVISNF
jgi:capsular exopolysaccharide synthesis family protein